MTLKSNGAALPPPPVAKKIHSVVMATGGQDVDFFAWMKQVKEPGDPLNPDILDYLQAENAYTAAYMADTAALQATLYAEMRGRMKEVDQSVPFQRGRFFYYTRTRAGDQYELLCRHPVGQSHREEIVLDENELAKGHKFFSIGALAYSPSAHLVAFAVDYTGDRRYKLFVKDLNTGEISQALADRVTSVEWCRDNKTMYYTTEDPVTKRSNQLWRHRLGTSDHVLEHEEKDEFYRIGVSKTRSGKFIYLSSGSHTTSTVSFIKASKPGSKFKLIAPLQAGIEYDVEDDGTNFYILTHDGAKNGRIVRVASSNFAPENWVDVVPHRADVLLKGCDVFKDHLVVYEMDDALPKVRVQKLSTGDVHYVDFPEAVYTTAPNANKVFDTSTLRLSYQSMVTTSEIIDYDLNTRSKTLLKKQEVPNFDPSQYHCERIYATAPDGTKIPMSIVYKGDLVKDGSRRGHLYGYGSYGICIPASFSFVRLSLLDRGLIYAIAHVRGGTDKGEDWHDQGKMANKMNTFTDFIACGEHLKKEGYVNPDLLGMQGGSAGGLLMGAVSNLAPGLSRVALPQVPFVDVVNTMLDTSLPLTVAEFEEWGNPAVPAEFAVIRAYSPYENIHTADYPAMLVEAAVEDSQVPYWEAAKYVAQMRDRNPNATRPVLLHMKIDGAGHGGASGRFDALKEYAFTYAFLLTELGIKA